MTSFENPAPGIFHFKVYGENRIEYTPQQMRERDLLQTGVTDEDYRRHHAEYTQRIRWCIDQGPGYWPAHENKHRAPGDDTNFIFQIPPWHADGSVNPLGVPDNRFVEPVLPGFELPVDYDSKTGWNCYKCQEWVSLPARQYEGKEEPEDWWWCAACRKNKPKMTARQKKVRDEVARIKDIRSLINTD
tara:strand:- start:14544 stop:15107 length:564 start_codon:yes stop_codon:yes gene_type:complete